MLSRPTLAVRAACAAVALCAFASAHAQAITDWNFGTYNASVSSLNTPPATTDSTGSASIQIIGMSGGPEGDITAETGAPGGGYVWRVRGTGNNGWLTTAAEYTQGIQADVSTAGETNISVSFNMAVSSNGIATAELEYSTNGGSSWVQADYVALTTSYTTQTFNIAAGGAESNNPNFEVRLVSAYAPGTNAYAPPAGGTLSNGSGNWRISDFQVDGTLAPTPLPAAAWLLVSAIGGLGAFARRRRQQA
jgi:hypothetical protein